MNREIARSDRIHVDVITGRIFANSAPLATPPAELAVLMLLAVSGRPLSREALSDALYPDTRSGGTAVKVNVYRVRRRLRNDEVIRCENGLYVLGWCVDVDLPRIETILRRLRREGVLNENAREMLQQLRRRLLCGRPPCTLGWSWFESTERRLAAMSYEVTMLLAQDALRAKRFEDALVLSGDVLKNDPLDEFAAEIAIRAMVQCGDRLGAVTQYRLYAAALERELQEKPPRCLKALLEGARGISA